MDELEDIRQKKMRDLLAKADSDTSPSSVPVAVSDATFEDFVKNNPLAVVDCWAEWCGPCRMIGPVVEQLARDFAGKVMFGKLNVDQNPATAARFGIMSIPTLLIVKDGTFVDSIVGAVPKDYIISKLQPYL